MSVPPPPNQWGSQPPTGGQPVARRSGDRRLAASWSAGPAAGGVAPPGPPPACGGKGKWIFGGIALLAVIAVTVVITVLVVGKDSVVELADSDADGRSCVDIASANDKGPATIITEDPTCASTRPILEHSRAKQREWLGQA